MKNLEGSTSGKSKSEIHNTGIRCFALKYRAVWPLSIVFSKT